LIHYVRLAAIGLIAALVLVFPVAPSGAAASGPEGGDYYYNAGRRLPLSRSAARLALRVPASASRSEALSRAAALPSVRASRDVGAGGVLELTLDDASAVPVDVRDLGRSLGGELLPVFVEPGKASDATTLFVTDEILVQFRPEVAREQIDALDRRLGVDEVEPLGYAPNGFKLRVNSGDLSRNALTVANAYFETGLCVWAHPNFLAKRSLRFTPNDPLFANQWHLNNTGQGGGVAGADVKAPAAWNVTQGSSSISVAVADTGIDYTHEDFNATVGGLPKVHDPRDVVHADNDPSPQIGDADRSHGTAASGVATAAGNNAKGVSGIAPGCRFIPIQLYAESTFTPNATEADAFMWAADHGGDVMSNSWGPDNPYTALPDATRTAIDYATTNGRGGKGMVIFFAAGNSAANIDQLQNNVPYDSYSSYSGVVAVSATTNSDRRSSYSNYGASISIGAPSNGGTLSITTTDVTGSAGYSSGNYTSSFGGTSSACPLAAGVGALVLSVNPNLTWRQVKSVLEQSADKIVDPNYPGYDANGHSDYFGYGRVNAQRAVALAVAGGPDTPGIYTGPAFFLRNSSTSGPANFTFTYGAAGATIKPVTGDWDGNGTDTVGIYDSSTGTFFLKNSNAPGAADLAFDYGPPGAVPLVGDWDGDGTDTVGIYVPATGAFFLRNSNTPGPADVAFIYGPSASTLVPVAGDWDGNGTSTIGLYDPSNGAFFLRNSNAPGAADLTFFFGAGGAGVTPLVGDWNNDGADSIGIYVSSTGAFFVKNTNASGAADWLYIYGAVGATPLAGNWDGQ
jgi:subtilisin family serine protease